ncbi:MAG: pyrroline-5-carboxylate reductase [Deltaproteobacteria bacterium]|nr:pyrroline-5-carboxylate reductase [Deltaproteobacteria bacterium]
MSAKPTIGFIGCGNMAQAMISGLLKKGFTSKQIFVFDVDLPKTKKFVQTHKINFVSDNHQLALISEVLILAIKPQEMKNVLREIAPFLRKQFLISIAAGVETALIRKFAPSCPILRSMPNNPALIGQGITGLYGKKLSAAHKTLSEKIFAGCGEIVWIEKEELLDVVTGLSGSGPAYVYAFTQALEEAGKRLGLPDNIAYQLALKTLIGSANTLLQTGKNPSELISLVTSKKGTTLEGLKVLKKYKMSEVLLKTVKAATKRAQEIRKELSQ